METQQDDESVFQVVRPEASSFVVLICEHASNHIPAQLNDLGLSLEARRSHVAWDPGALAVAEAMSRELDAVLVASQVSRLVYDCNRPPEAPDAMPVQSETYVVPGNQSLTDTQKRERVARYYLPFHDAIAAEVSRRSAPIIVTLHSFTPIYHGKMRDVEIGILHDADSRLADAIMSVTTDYDVRRNAPYGPRDGVTHTLIEHATKDGHLNVMIEVRSDLIVDPIAQRDMAKTLTRWLNSAFDALGVNACRG